MAGADRGIPSASQSERAEETRLAVASYIASLIGELRSMARSNEMPTLAYLLDIARLEAEDAARGSRDG